MTPTINISLPASQVGVRGFHASPSTGATYSWVDWVSMLLDEAEKAFGPRDTNWFFAGIEFTEDPDAPCTYYVGKRPTHIGIMLQSVHREDLAWTAFALAHEVVHLLGRARVDQHGKRPRANVMEEGMASWFQLRVSEAAGLKKSLTDPSYTDAEALLRRLLEIDETAVRRIRNEFSDLRALKPADIVRIVPGVDPDLAMALATPFAGRTTAS